MLLGAVLAGGFLAMNWWGDGPSSQDGTVIVVEGTSLSGLGDQLREEDRISLSPMLWRATTKLFGGGDPIQAGEFEMPAGASPATILDIVQHGRTVQRQVTIPEGMPSILVQERIAALDFLNGEAPLPEEGSILPQTYSYQRGESRAALVGRMEAAMDELLEELWPTRSTRTVVSTIEEAVILASIVEKETGKAEERPMVAGVMSNRIRTGMRLDADATTIYPITQGKPLGRMIRRSELRDPNPYNTRAVLGLPPGPITNPGRESIAAVLNPAETSALFYVADGTGGHVFADTLEEHNRNVVRWRQIRAERGE